MKAIFLMGLPLAGKSTWIQDNMEDDYTLISADELKEKHPAYDPDATEKLHEWSVREAEKIVKKHIAEGKPFILDSGGINTHYTIDLMTMAKQSKFYIKLVHVKTPYWECIRRLEGRERKVPAQDIFDKAIKENAQFHKLKAIAMEYDVIEYFTNTHIFMDMDGVIAAQSVLPEVNGEIDFVNGEIHLWQAPVIAVLNKIEHIKNMAKILQSPVNFYILSASPTSFSTDEKNRWLDKHWPVPQEYRFYINQGKHKAEMLDNLVKKLKLRKQDVLLVDDYHDTLVQVTRRQMNAMHVSEFLTHDFYKLRHKST